MALRFFRRHRKWFMILVVAAVISMVGWLVARQMLPKITAWISATGRHEVIGHIGGEAVTAGELGYFAAGLRAAGRATQVWYEQLVRRAPDREAATQIYHATIGRSAWSLLTQGLTDPDRVDRPTALAWLALRREAERLGFRTPPAAVEARLQALRSLGLSEADIARATVRQAGGNRDLLLEGLADDMTLADYIQFLYETAQVPVEPELRKAYTEEDLRLRLRLAVFKVEDALDEVGQPPEDVLLALFNKYKAYLPGQGPDGRGYRIPAKADIEYLMADPKAYLDEAARAVTEEKVRAYYEANKETEFVVEEPKGADAAADEKVSGEKPAKTYRPLDEVREEIRARLVEEEAARLAREALAEAVGEIATKKQKDLALDIWADGVHIIHVDVPGPRTAAELAEMPGLGEAVRDRLSLPEAALSVVELVGPEKAHVAVGEISEVFTAPDGRAFAFRVQKVVPSREPTSLDEVRRAVVADARRQEALRLVRERAKRLLEAAAEKGLEAAAAEARVETVLSEWVPRERFIPIGGQWLRIPPTLPKVGASPVVLSACFRMVEEGRQRTLVTLPDRGMVVVAELAGKKPPREAGFKRALPLLLRRVGGGMAGRVVRDLLDPKNIQRRLAVVAVEEERPPAKPKEGGGSESGAGKAAGS